VTTWEKARLVRRIDPVTGITLAVLPNPLDKFMHPAHPARVWPRRCQRAGCTKAALPRSQFCSRRCWYLYQKANGKDHTCAVCSRPFYATRPDQQCCTRSCGRRHRSMHEKGSICETRT